MNFQNLIINWYLIHKRDLPWRHTNDPYVIWLSEIILQQTRVDQGLPYFNKFLSNYPTVNHFASAEEVDILKLWQGLGYYSRGRNMHKTAKLIVENLNGVFPTDYNSLLKLKGVGEYTAAAISSFSVNEPKAVLDGNVFRVLARYFGVYTPIDTTEGKKIFKNLAQDMLFIDNPGLYNQAIMEFGALQCKPKSPNCILCPLFSSCQARLDSSIDKIPFKAGKIIKKIRYINYLIIKDEVKILSRMRMPGDVWQHLYDFPSFEYDFQPDSNDPYFIKDIKTTFGELAEIKFVNNIKHVLTHQIIHVQFFELTKYISNFSKEVNWEWVTIEDFSSLPHSKVIHDFYNRYLIGALN